MHTPMVLSLAMMGTVLAGCGEVLVESVAPAAPPVLCRLEFRDRLLDLRPGARGMRFDVRRRDGGLIASGLSASELQAVAPSIHELYQRSVVAAPALWAGD